MDIHIEPCTSWNESTRTGTFNWTNVDALIQAIFNIGSEPLVCFGFVNENGFTDAALPPGMSKNSATGLPYPNQYATYCAEWVKHFKQTGKPVRFYEVVNEPWMYFQGNFTNLSNLIAIYNATRPAMKAQNPNISVGFNADSRVKIMNYWLDPAYQGSHEVGADIDFMSFHKYDSGTIGGYSDAEMFNRAETRRLTSDGFWYSPNNVQQIYLDARGKTIPIFDSEGNFNSAWQNGSDPDITTMTGATWLALKLRSMMLEEVSMAIYWRLATSKTAASQKPSGGWGLVMINADDKQPYYPYYVQWLIGRNLSVGDKFLETASASANIRTLAWKHGNTLNILLIHKSNTAETVNLRGLSGELQISFIDNTIPHTNPALQTGIINAEDPLHLNGYTVMLLQSLITNGPPTPIPLLPILGPSLIAGLLLWLGRG